MLKELVEHLQNISHGEVINFGPRAFTTRPVYDLPAAPMASPFECCTLTGVASYLHMNPDQLNLKEVLIHVQSPQCVQLFSKLGERNKRSYYLEANCEGALSSQFPFRQYMDAEKFIVGLLSEFKPNPDIEKILKVVGNLKAEQVTTSEDDGVTQRVTVRRGVSRLENTDLEPIVNLSPYRTFREVKQPESAFVLRMKSDKEGSIPKCGLFDADGGGWKLKAINDIAEWLAAELEDLTVPIVY